MNSTRKEQMGNNRCIYCGKEAEFIAFGCSVCGKHLIYMEDQVPHADEMINFAEQTFGERKKNEQL